VDYVDRTPGSRSLNEEFRRWLPGGDTRSITWFAPYPVLIDHAAGHELVDADGRSYIDLLNNYTALVHGHAHPRIVEAITEQARRGTVYPAPHAGQAALAAELVRRVESVERVRFTNSGSEAVMQSIKAARAFTRRPLLVKADGGYHGSWDQVPLTAAEAHGQGTPAEVAGLVRFVPYNDLDALGALLAREGDRVAAILLEPVMGEGVIAASAEYLHGVRELATAYGALMVLDEVVTFRLAEGGRQQTLGVSPDLTTFGKVIGGGLPVGAVGGSERVMSVFDPSRPDALHHSGTFNGNTLTTAAGLVSLELLTRSEIERIDALGASLADGLREAIGAHGLRGCVTRCGSLLHLHFDVETEPSAFGDLALDSPTLAHMHLACMEEGLFIAPRGLLNTSTAMDEAAVTEAVARFARAAARVGHSGSVSAAAAS
jgi:glutamate-1-semialdehyde 2,1-aminomutase